MFEWQPCVLLCQGGLCVVGRFQVVELDFLRSPVEVARAGEAV
jgi:hypothetical protein